MDKRQAVPFTIHQTKYLKFVVVRYKPKTKVIAVASKSSGEELGRIEWFAKWRQYCFMPNGMTVWNTDCLKDIQNIITTMMMSHRAKPKTIGVVCKDMNDFLMWSRKKKHKRTGNADSRRRYVHGTTTYVGFSQLTHCIGYSLDKIVETEAAHLNPNYNQLVQNTKICLLKPKS